MRINTLKRNKEFRVVYGRGRSAAAKNLVLFVLKRRGGGTRPGFSISKKIGGAVTRNKVRRRLKAMYSDIAKRYVFNNYDIIFVARQPVCASAYSAVASEMEYLLRKTGVLGERLIKTQQPPQSDSN